MFECDFYPTCVMLIGLPASGKSTFVDSVVPLNFVVVSSDDHVEVMADNLGLTYSEAFKDVIKEATNRKDADFEFAVANKQSMVLDMTNLSKKSRRKYSWNSLRNPNIRSGATTRASTPHTNSVRKTSVCKLFFST